MGIVIGTILGLAITIETAIAVASAALSIAMVLTAKKPQSPSAYRSQAERKQTLRSSTASSDWVVGRTVKAAILNFPEEEVGGWLDENPDPEENQGYVEWLHLVHVFCDHPIDSIGRIWLNDDLIETLGDNVTYDLMNDRTVADPFLLEHCPSWKPDMIGRGLAALRISMRFSQKKFPSGIPNIKMEIFGRKIYDPRDKKTKWSDNAALIYLDFIRHHPSIKVPDSRVDWESFKVAASICDEIVTRPDGAREKRYAINGAFDMSERPSSIMDDMLLAMAGERTEFGGMHGLMVGAYYGGMPTTVTSDQILANVSITPEASKRDRINTINGTFVDPVQLYVETDYPQIQISEWVQEDGEEIKDDLKLRFVTSDYQAQRLANIQMRRKRLGRTLSFKMNASGYGIRQGMYIQLKIPQMSIDSEMRVIDWSLDPSDMSADITVRQDGIEIWEDAIGKPMERPPLTNLPSGIPAPSSLQYRTEVVGEVVQGLITWLNTAQVAYTNILIKRAGTLVYTAQEMRTIHRIQGLPVGDYSAELIAVGMSGAQSAISTLAFSIQAPPSVIGCDIRAGNWEIGLTPKLATSGGYGTQFEFFYYRTPLPVGEVIATAELLGSGTQLTHGGRQPDTLHYYWIRAINAYGQGPLFALEAKTTKDVNSVLDVIAGQIGADALTDELRSEIDKIPAIETEIGQLVTPGQLAAAVKTETDERITQDSALGKRIDTVTASTNTTAAGLQTEIEARAEADSALGKRIDTVTATANGNTAAIQEETAARVSSDEAIASQITTLISETEVNKSAIQSEAKTRSDADSALTDQINTVSASTAETAAGLRTEQQARADADSALGKRVDTVSATVGDNTAAIQTVATAGTTDDGETMNAMWSTRASLNDITGGFGLIAEKDPDGATRIKFIVDADIFAVLDRSGGKRNPFVIKDGVVYMNKLLLDDAEIGAVIAKYINVDHLVGALIEGGSFRGGEMFIGENPNGPWSAHGKKWNSAFYNNGDVKVNNLTGKNCDLTGTINANAGTMNNITIAENCQILGTLKAGQIEGDIDVAKAYPISSAWFSHPMTRFISFSVTNRTGKLGTVIIRAAMLVSAKVAGGSTCKVSGSGRILNGSGAVVGSIELGAYASSPAGVDLDNTSSGILEAIVQIQPNETQTFHIEAASGYSGGGLYYIGRAKFSSGSAVAQLVRSGSSFS